MKYISVPEPLESRIAPASAVGRALDLPDDATVDVSGTRNVGLSVGHNYITGGLGAFPTGADNDFIVLSTGDATKAYAPRPASYPHFGLDHGKKGAYDDLQHLQITVPVAAGQTHVKFDFNLMTDEIPGGDFDDSFSVLATPHGAGSAETLVQLKVNDSASPFLATAPANAIYAHHTGVHTADYRIPAGATSVTFDFYIADRPAPSLTAAGDGTGDTAVVIDNFRFTSAPQIVWLNFEGATISNMVTQGTAMQIPAFQLSDIGASGDRTTLINSMFSNVAAKFAAYDIDFVLTPPTSGEFISMSIGGTGNNTVTLGAGADPRLVRALGTTTTTDAVMNQVYGFSGVFGLADSVDFGNASVSGNGFVHSGNFAPFYSGESAATIQQRLEVTTAHEIAHTLGVAHLDDSFDNNIMAQLSPRSPTATFEDISRTLVSANPDGRTSLNVHEYLQGILGSATGSVFVNATSVALSNAVMQMFLNFPLFNLSFGFMGSFADSAGGPDSSTKWITIDELKAGANEIEIPNFGPDTQVIFFGSTTDGGPVDFFSGTPASGDMNMAAGFVPLYDGSGMPVASIPAAQGALGGGLTEVAGGVGVGISKFVSANLNPVNPRTGFVFTQADGDIVTVKLASKTGTAAIALTPDGNSIDRIELQGTSIKDKLTVSVKRKADGPDLDKLPDGDGLVDIGAIVGPALGTLNAKSSNLVGAGLEFGGVVGTITLRDIENGADILTGGTFATKTSITARDIRDASTIDVDGQLKLTAARVGEGKIEAALLSGLNVKGDKLAALAGDFESDVTIIPGKVLTATEAKLKLLGPVNIAGRAIDADFVVPGHAGAFKAGTFEHSSLLLGFAPTNAGDPFAGGAFTGDFKLTSFASAGIKNFAGLSFIDSTVIGAQLGPVTIATLDSTNSSTAFGFAAKSGLARNLAGIIVKNPAFKFVPTDSLPKNLDDFFVKVV